jgi:16S rRNA (cytosine1402-N4)-methyltransferase
MLVATDLDAANIEPARAMLDAVGGLYSLHHSNFAGLANILAAESVPQVDGLLADLGMSSMQVDDRSRGFSFMRDGPLDMRMSGTGLSAADVVNTYEKGAIADILYTLGDERRSRAIAAAIVKDREETPFERTGQLAALIARVLGHKPGDPKHPATRSFQALRLYVNDELGELTRALAAAERLLKPGGRLVVVSFHSLEDRIVKRFLAERSGKRAKASRYIPDAGDVTAPTFELRDRHGVEPGEDEVAANPRARSARLRWAVRTDAPPLA